MSLTNLERKGGERNHGALGSFIIHTQTLPCHTICTLTIKIYEKESKQLEICELSIGSLPSMFSDKKRIAVGKGSHSKTPLGNSKRLISKIHSYRLHG